MDTKTQDKFRANCQRRYRAVLEVDRARQELERLLVTHRRRCSVTEMAEAASISRETAHKLLRRREAS